MKYFYRLLLFIIMIPLLIPIWFLESMLGQKFFEVIINMNPFEYLYKKGQYYE